MDLLQDSLPDAIRGKCLASEHVTDKGDVSFTLEAESQGDAEHCHDVMRDLVGKVNEGDESLSDDPITAALATAVVLGVEEDGETRSPTIIAPGGGVAATVSIGLLIPIIAAMCMVLSLT